MTLYCRRAKLKLPLKSTVEEYKCGKSRLRSMLEDSEDPVAKTIQPITKTSRKWKVLEVTDQATECLKIKEVIGQTQIGRKGMGSSVTEWWSKVEGKEKRDMVINEIRLNEDSRRLQEAVQQPQQGQWPFRNRSHGIISSTWRHFGSAFSSDQCTISCPPMQT